MEKFLYLSGKKSIQEVIENDSLKSLIDVVYCTTKEKNLQFLCEQNNIKNEIKNKEWFKKWNKKSKYIGSLALLKKKNNMTLNDFLLQSAEKTTSLIVVLEKIQDSYNFGAILRSCAAAGVDCVIYSKNKNSPINSTVLKSSQGCALSVNLIDVVNINQTLNILKKNNYWIYSSDGNKKNKNIYETKFNNKIVVVFGNEGDGISPQILKNSDYVIKIPMNNKINSLNVSVAVGVVVFYAKNYLSGKAINDKNN